MIGPDDKRLLMNVFDESHGIPVLMPLDKYFETGEVVEVKGQFFVVETILENVLGGGLALRRLTSDEKSRLEEALGDALTDDMPTRNRSERREKDRKLRLMLKERNKRGSRSS